MPRAMLFKDKKPDSGTHRVSVGDIYFWGEQNGPVEDEFKAKLIASNLFKAEVKEAYLMRVRYPEATTENVALCLISDTGHEPELVRKIGEIFKSTFNSDQFLDTIFLEHQYWKRVRSIAKPFFSSEQRP
jgi:hypothetical protein